MSESRFVGARLRLARLLAEQSQSALADSAGLDQSLISRLEKGERDPTPLVARALAEALAVQQDFFYSPAPTDVYDEEVHFRHRSRMALFERNRALAHVTLVADVLRFLEEFIEFPTDQIPHISARSVEEIELAAEQTRARLGLAADRPISNVTRALENAGVVVLAVDGYLARVDAFSVGTLGRKLIILHRKDSGSRAAFSAAHELAHLVIHPGVETGSRETEGQADRFASAFLLPRRAFAREFRHSNPIRWAHLLELKSRWRVSLQALVRRAYDLGLITAMEYQRYYKALSAAGWRASEPNEFAMPEPELLVSAFSILAEERRISVADAAGALGLRPSTLVDLAGLEGVRDEDVIDPRITSLTAERVRRRGKH